MKKYNVFYSVLVLLVLISVGCNTKNKNVLAQTNDTIIVNKPIENFNVKRYYDNNGNQIGYDSVYTYSYSSSGNGQMPMEIDSIFNQFNNNFGMYNFNFSFSPDDFFGNDNFFNNNIDIQQMMRIQQQQMEQMQKMMDSLQNIQQKNIEQYNNQQRNNKQEDLNKTKNQNSKAKVYDI